ncbi:MAG: DMT family transporter [Bdellovibrionales bacterium]
MSKKWVAVLQLLVAAGFWGFGFVAAVWALKVVNAFELTLARFVLAVMVSFIFLLVTGRRRAWGTMARIALVPGFLLALMLIVQTWGLEYTTATKAGFITTLYAVFTPLLEFFHRGRRLGPQLWLSVGVAFLGTLMIVNLGLKDLNWGDLLCLICAMAGAGQIYYLGLVSPKVTHPFVLNTMQASWALLFSAPFAFSSGLLDKFASWSQWPWEAQVGLLSLAFGSTILAFYLQVKAQAHLSATVTSLLCLLESPLSMFFAVMLLSEKLTMWEATGALLIFLATISASWSETRPTKRIVDFDPGLSKTKG